MTRHRIIRTLKPGARIWAPTIDTNAKEVCVELRKEQRANRTMRTQLSVSNIKAHCHTQGTSAYIPTMVSGAGHQIRAFTMPDDREPLPLTEVASHLFKRTKRRMAVTPDRKREAKESISLAHKARATTRRKDWGGDWDK